MLLLDKLAENNIRASIDKGELDNLPGQGRALVLDDDSAIPKDLRAAYRILKNSGYLPAEIELRSEIVRLEDLLQFAHSDDERASLIVKIALLRSKAKR